MTKDCYECKYALENFNDKLKCTKHNKNIDNSNPKACADYAQLQFCDTCAYARTLVYETGEIDCIDYRCTLQNNRLIYSDNNPMHCQNAKYPECAIGLYEEDKSDV